MSSASFDLLDTRIQHWIWSNGWTQMREVQEKAIPAILDANSDVIIAAATAAGKTEAAFMPILTDMLRDGNENSLSIYISPLKALINDQFGRLEQLCNSLEIEVWPWHGDVNASSKARFFKQPSGVLLITPESLEAMFCNRGTHLRRIFSRLKFIVVDELHAFIGSERGKQLQSLMHRIDLVLEKRVPRVGLSATLGDMRLGAQFLRPDYASQVQVIEANTSGSNIKIQLRGYCLAKPVQSSQSEDQVDIDRLAVSQGSIADHLFKCLRGTNNLIFPNSRSEVEAYTYLLKSRCEQSGVPNEFWPHHGSLSKAAREETELALKDKTRSCNAIATSTLELGIDLGAVVAVAQIGSPHSVASLRQRLGRSGRREGEPAILRAYVQEEEVDSQSCLSSLIREELFQFSAMISLLLEGWFEPPNPNGLHLSTLIQQLLSTIAQHGGLSTVRAYKDLIESGPFSSLSRSDFIALLRHLGKIKILEQDSSGLLLLGELGEAHVNHYSFYAAFASDEEFRLYNNTELLGTIPVTSSLSLDQVIIFSGRTWQVKAIDEEAKIIQLSRCKGGRPPPFLNPKVGQIHTKVRERMRELYLATTIPRFLDGQASSFFVEGQKYFQQFGLSETTMRTDGKTLQLLTWQGDSVNAAIAAMLRMKQFVTSNYGAIIEITLKSDQDPAEVIDTLGNLARSSPPTVDEILSDALALRMEKWDWALPAELIRRGYASLRLDIAAGHDWIRSNFTSTTVAGILDSE